MTSEEPIIAIRNARKTFGAREALAGVSLEVPTGAMVGLIGPSGSGKSTLLRAISGLAVIDPGEGEIEAFGAVVQTRGRLTEHMRDARVRTGFIFQQFTSWVA